jgi:lysophospholipase L1-like esterase
VAYLAQLGIPLLILYDVGEAYALGLTGRSWVALLGVGSTWLAGGLILWFRRGAAPVSRWLPNVTLLVFASATGLLASEVVISTAFPAFATGLKRTPHLPNLRVEMVQNPLAIPGQVLTTVYRTNELGMRGPRVTTGSEAFGILAIGGSTTECAALDDEDTWPHDLMLSLTAVEGRKVWVQNAGVSGHTSTDHLYMLRTNPFVRRADLILILVGVNDLTATLAFEGRSVNAQLEQRAQVGFSVFPRYTRLATVKLVRNLVLTAETSPLRYDHTGFYEEMRARRRSAPIVPAPDLSPGVAEYRGRITRLAAECRRLQKRCVFLTQPALWKAEFTREELEAIWLGYVGPVEAAVGYVSPSSLEQAMERFNQALIEAAGAHGVEVFDLARRIPKTLAHFYDDAHFTNEGARIVGREVARYLTSRSSGD